MKSKNKRTRAGLRRDYRASIALARRDTDARPRLEDRETVTYDTRDGLKLFDSDGRRE